MKRGKEHIKLEKNCILSRKKLVFIFPIWGFIYVQKRQQEAEGKRSLSLSRVGPELSSVGEYFKNISDKKHSPRSRFCSSFLTHSGNSTSHEFQLTAQIKCRPLGNTSGVRALSFFFFHREQREPAQGPTHP